MRSFTWRLLFDMRLRWEMAKNSKMGTMTSITSASFHCMPNSTIKRADQRDHGDEQVFRAVVRELRNFKQIVRHARHQPARAVAS